MGSNQPRLIANTSTRPSAIRKPGIAKPSTATTCTTRSAQPRRLAASTPSATETTAVTTVAPMTRERVTASLLVSASVTGWPVNQETPRSPWRALDTQSPKRVSSGWSRPSSCFFSSTVSSVADWPRMLRAMLPAEM